MKRKINDTVFPNDVLTEILLQLPLKTIGRCKCVCRQWNNLIRNPSFMNHPGNPTRLLAAVPPVRRMPLDKYKFKLFADESLSLLQDIHCPANLRGRCYDMKDILGPVNGLYFMSYMSFDHHVFHEALWNPSTSEFRELPFVISPNGSYVGRYFGFGSAGTDIKVVYIYTFYGELDGSGDPVEIKLYSLNDDSWKDVETDYFARSIARGPNPVSNNLFNHLNGVYYWLTVNYFISFDMETEEFKKVNLPELESWSDRVMNICVRDNSSIVLFVRHYINTHISSRFGNEAHQSLDLWERKEDGGEWIKLFSFGDLSTFSLFYFSPYGFWKKDEIFFKRKDHKKVVLFNMNSHEIRNLEIDIDVFYSPLYLLNYNESVTSVRKPVILDRARFEPRILLNVN